MAKVLLSIIDLADGRVGMDTKFDPPLDNVDEPTPAQKYALQMLAVLAKEMPLPDLTVD